MIRGMIDFALRNRLMVLGGALVLFVWGIVSFHNLPIEAYPDVADTYAQIITQWPGHAAEEVETEIRVPLHVQCKARSARSSANGDSSRGSESRDWAGLQPDRADHVLHADQHQPAL